MPSPMSEMMSLFVGLLCAAMVPAMFAKRASAYLVRRGRGFFLELQA